MDLLQAALIFLILLLSIFLAITGFQVFLILRDLKKALDRLNKVLQVGENIAQDVQKPVEASSNLVSILATRAKAVGDIVRRDPKPKPKRFYKKVL